MPVLRTRGFLFGCLLMIGFKSYSQDTIPKLSEDSVWFTFDRSFLKGLTILSSYYQSPFNYYLDHNPEKKDERNLRRYRRFINRKPNSKNNTKYFSLAYSLWELSKLTEAEKMFLAIEESEDVFYTSTYYNSSDVPGDTTTNIYGYGSFTSNYKNYAAKYLTKIYLEQKQFDKALKYLEDAVNKYPVTYTCGTGYNMQRDEYDFLYSSCYLGLNMNKELLDLLLLKCLDRSDDIIVKAIKDMYTEKEVEFFLTEGEKSIKCLLDTFPSYAYLTSEISKGVEKTDTISYYSGSATIMLFDRLVDIPVPNLENGERLTKEMFIKRYKESDFYTRLAVKKDDSEEEKTTGSTKK
jgi:tetratricopeptide (TPR) repeat protein